VKKEIVPSNSAAALTNLGQHTHSAIDSLRGTVTSSLQIVLEQMFGTHVDFLRH
jgi:hypothetical protein